jgi:F-type H+-transporting ATPase subunit delta
VIEGSITQRWARALLQLAVEQNKVVEFREQLNGFAALMQMDNGKLGDVLASASFSRKDKVAIVNELANGQNLLPELKNFLGLAMEKNRGHYVVPIVERFNRMADEATGVAKAELTVAAPLADDVKERIASALAKATKKKIELEVKVDPAIVGGASVRMGSLVVDGTLRSQLEELARDLGRVE